MISAQHASSSIAANSRKTPGENQVGNISASFQRRARTARLNRLEVRTIGRIVKAVAEAKGFSPEKWHPHLLRHACGTHMHDHDAPLQAVASLLGHARLSTAQIYTRVSVGRMMKTYNATHPHARVNAGGLS